MRDFIEIDFIEAGDRGSGDAIAIRRRNNGFDYVYVVDGGYTADGQKLVDHIRKHYSSEYRINHLVLTHPDADHASGLDTLMREIKVDCLWMNLPWRHVDRLLPMFKRYQDRDRLIARLRSAFPKAEELEALALSKSIMIREAFTGSMIGEFMVLSPSLETFLQLIVESDNTPVPASRASEIAALIDSLASRAAWGEENLKGDTEGTTPDNETSIVQFANVCGMQVLLTGDAGVRALTEARWVASQMGITAFPPDWFQVPHHGSRRNLSSSVLDAWFGIKQPGPLQESKFDAIISANQNDQEHPKKAVVRALIHRGGRAFQTNGTLHMRSTDAPGRGWTTASPLKYPQDQEP